MAKERVVGYLNDELFKRFKAHMQSNNLNRNELVNLALIDYLNNSEKEWQVLFKAFERLNRRLEKVEVNQTVSMELILWLVQMFFMDIPRNYTEAELSQIDEKTQEDMKNFMKAFKRALKEGGIYSPKLQGTKLGED
jgi:glutamate-1-semialdehyde aminotransferase